MFKKNLIKVVALLMLGLSLAITPISSFIGYCEETTTQATTNTNISTNKETNKTSKEEPKVIYHTDTVKNADNPCQVTVTFTIPEGFGLSAYVQFMNNKGDTYQITSSEENGYSDRAYVPYGEYIVVDSGIMGDNVGNYSFDITNDRFVLSESNVLTSIQAKMSNYAEVAEQIANANGTTTVKPEDETPISDDTLFKTAIEYIKLDSTGNYLFDNVCSNKNFKCQVTGNPVVNEDILLTVNKAGIIGEAKASVSLDGGQTSIGDITLKSSTSISSLGVTFVFKTEVDTNEFKIGDTISTKVIETYKLTTNNYRSNIVATGYSETKASYKFVMMSTGGRGVAKCKIIKNEIESDYKLVTIPEDGVLEYDGYTFYFSDSEFKKNGEYIINTEDNHSKTSYVPLYVICVLLGVALLSGYVFLMTKKEKKKDYRINVWKDRQASDKYE